MTESVRTYQVRYNCTDYIDWKWISGFAYKHLSAYSTFEKMQLISKSLLYGCGEYKINLKSPLFSTFMPLYIFLEILQHFVKIINSQGKTCSRKLFILEFY